MKNSPLKNECSSDLTACYEDSNNDNKYIYCVPSDEKCPISAMKLASEPPNDDYKEKDSIEIPGLSQKLYISRTAINLPIVESRITEGDGVC
jgi:hypothetical protein